MPAAAPDTLVEPAFLWVPPHTHTRGPEAADLAASVGMVPDAEQRLVLDSFLATSGAGAFVARTCVVVAARQNLKTAALEMLALDDLFLAEPDLNVWTSHRYDAARETFDRLKALVDNFDHLRRRVAKITSSPGEQEITCTSGSRLKFQARSTGAGRALSGRVLYYDEGFALQPAHVGASVPILSTRRHAQVRVGSSAGRVDSEVLRGYRDVGRSARPRTMCYIEWCAPVLPCESGDCPHTFGVAGCVMDREDLWRLANPAMGRRISAEAIQAEREMMIPVEFARERLGWWEDPATSGSDLTLAQWQAVGDPDDAPAGPLVFGVDASLNLASASIVACGGGRSGVPVLEVVDRRRGASWLVPRLAELVERHRPLAVGLDPGAPVAALIPELESTGLDLVLLDARTMAQSSGALVAAVQDNQVRHRDEPALNQAVAGATRRDAGDGAWRWSRRDSGVDISPLIAATVALRLWTGRDGPYDPLANIY